VPQPFPREVLAVTGSREPFHARMLPYFDHSDHHSFTPAHIGVPATALINWPDPFIHSTGDDLDNVDPTQIERNALVAGAVAWYFAALGDDDVPALATWVDRRGRARVAADVATAIARLATAKDPSAAWREAHGLVVQSWDKEDRSLSTLVRLSDRAHLTKLLEATRAQRSTARAADLRALEEAFSLLTGTFVPPASPGELERKMRASVFVPEKDIGKMHDALENAGRVEGLHPMMRFEAWNFADGRRTAWDVYEAVAAEALSAGSWYFGEVTPTAVLESLDKAAEAGAFTRTTAVPAP